MCIHVEVQGDGGEPAASCLRHVGPFTELRHLIYIYLYIYISHRLYKKANIVLTYSQIKASGILICIYISICEEVFSKPHSSKMALIM